MVKISNAFKKLYSACEPYLSDKAKKKISEILETKLKAKSWLKFKKSI